jgi:hypothetical protein
MKYTKKRYNKKRVYKKNSRKNTKKRIKTKNNRKSNSKKHNRRVNKNHVKMVQSGGFVGPLLPEFSNLFNQIPHGMSVLYNGLNPPPVSAPANPMKNSINPHPTKDQYLRGKGPFLDKNEVLGPKLPEVFDTHVKANPPLGKTP